MGFCLNCCVYYDVCGVYCWIGDREFVVVGAGVVGWFGDG